MPFFQPGASGIQVSIRHSGGADTLLHHPLACPGYRAHAGGVIAALFLVDHKTRAQSSNASRDRTSDHENLRRQLPTIFLAQIANTKHNNIVS